MNGFPQQLEQALRDIIVELPDAIRNNNLEQLGTDAKRQVFEAVATALLGNDRNTVAAALLDALRDDTITPLEWSSILKAWAGELVGSNPIGKDILTAFDDNKLSKEEAVSILVKWVKSEIEDPAITAVIDGVSTFFHVPGAPEALARYLANAGLPDAIAQGIPQAMATGKITAQQVFQILATWAATSGEDDIARIRAQLPNTPPEDIILGAIGERLPSEVMTILEKLLESDWSGLLATVLGALDLGLGQKLLANVAAGKYRDAAINEIVALLTQAFGQQELTGPLADAIIGLATGARSLFASGPEPDAPDLKSPAMIALWREIRSVIYMAQLACKGGDLIPTQPQAQPHIFMAAVIHFGTPLNLLVSPDANSDQRKDFCNTLTAFLDVHFGDRMVKRFLDVPPVLVMTEDELSSESRVTCKSVYLKVDMRLKTTPSGG